MLRLQDLFEKLPPQSLTAREKRNFALYTMLAAGIGATAFSVSRVFDSESSLQIPNFLQSAQPKTSPEPVAENSDPTDIARE